MQFLSRAFQRGLIGLTMGVLVMTGCGGSSSTNSGSNGNTTATPTFSPGAGAYSATQTVTIADTTNGAVLYCTTDGTMPTTSSPVCSQPTQVFKTELLQAIAVAPGMSPSAVSGANYLISLPSAATPTFNPAGGTYTTAQTVTISDATSGAVIYYTTDGTPATTASTLYVTGTPISVSKSETLSAVATASNLANSPVASATYTINLGTPTPIISPAGGSFTSPTTVTLTDAAGGAVIYYTTDGSVPTTSSSTYGAPFQVSSTTTVKAIAVAPSLPASGVASATFTFSIAGPTFIPAAGTYASSQTVTINDATAGAAIYYTTDGSMPTATPSELYSAPINVAATETIKAIAVTSSGTSGATSAVYTISTSTPAPTFLPAAGTFTSPTSVTINDATAGASIYYTTDGSTPTATPSELFSPSTPITVSATETINAIAVSSSGTSGVASAVYTINSTLTLNGTVVSGTASGSTSKPVSGATVQLYAAGLTDTDYGKGASALLTTAATTTSAGAFTFSYNCPAAPSGSTGPSDMVYLVATGGDSGAGKNRSITMMTALGSCSALTATTPIVVNEATTVASAYALSAFMTTSSGGVGSTATNYQGLANAFGTAGNMVNMGTGEVLTITPAYAASPVAGLHSSTVPTARINTLANMLNGCVNSSGGSCSNLFTHATPSGGTAPTDTLQAILNIAQNPGTNVSDLFGDASPSGPFNPVLGPTAPNDWTIALTYTGAGLGVQPGGSGAQVINQAMAIDMTGNIWVLGKANALSAPQGSPYTTIFSEFSSLGAPISPDTTQTTASPAVTTYGGYQPVTSLDEGVGVMAFDGPGNLWVGGGPLGSGGLAELTPGSSGLGVAQSGLPTAANVLSLAIDGLGNVWAGENGGGGFDLYSGATRVSDTAGWPTSFSAIGLVALPTVIFDSLGNLWAASDDTFGDLDVINPADGTNLGYAIFIGAVYSPVAADGTGNIYGCLSPTQLYAANAKTVATDSPSGPATSLANQYTLATGRGCGGKLVIDGLGHAFAISGTATPTAPTIIDEFTLTGTSLSPSATGYTGTSSGEAVTINPDLANTTPHLDPTGTLVPTSGVVDAAMDGSGNLWVLNADTGTSAGTTGNVLVEYVGIGAPVATPTALGLANGTIGVRP